MGLIVGLCGLLGSGSSPRRIVLAQRCAAFLNARQIKMMRHSTVYFGRHFSHRINRPFMKVYRGAPRASDRAPCSLTVGNFDGVHRGHQALLTRVVAAARARDLVPAVMTFEPHPREFFAPERAPARISNLRDKLAAFERCGIERTFVAHFNRRLRATSTERVR